MTNTSTTESVQIAMTIMDQIPVMDKMAVGYRNPQAMMESPEARGGLRFKVNQQPKRYVEIELCWNDTYRVTYFRLKRGTYERITLAKSDNIYCDMLGSEIYNMTQKTDDFNKSQGAYG